MSFLDLLVYPLAVSGLVDLFLHGSIFASLRARIEAYGGWRAQLVGCPYCLTYQVALWLVFLFWCVPALTGSSTVIALTRTVVYFLAVARVAWMTDALLPEVVRYTRPPL